MQFKCRYMPTLSLLLARNNSLTTSGILCAICFIFEFDLTQEEKYFSTTHWMFQMLAMQYTCETHLIHWLDDLYKFIQTLLCSWVNNLSRLSSYIHIKYLYLICWHSMTSVHYSNNTKQALQPLWISENSSIIFVTPEAAEDGIFWEFLRKFRGRMCGVALDEIHCVIGW